MAYREYGVWAIHYCDNTAGIGNGVPEVGVGGVMISR